MHCIIWFLFGLDVPGWVFARYVRPMLLDILFERKDSSNEGGIFVDVRLQLGKDLFLSKHGRVNRLVGNVVGGSGQLASDFFAHQEDPNPWTGRNCEQFQWRNLPFDPLVRWLFTPWIARLRQSRQIFVVQGENVANVGLRELLRERPPMLTNGVHSSMSKSSPTNRDLANHHQSSNNLVDNFDHRITP